ncbi:hypothetical protein SprV_0401544900 [Sparganum proliferum]
MIDRSLQHRIFGKHIGKYEKSFSASEVLASHGININDERSSEPPVSLTLPELLGENVAQHFEKIAQELTAPYVRLINTSPLQLPSLPKRWELNPGWTRYEDAETTRVRCPLEDLLFFDVEVLVQESDAPVLAVAMSPSACKIERSSPKLVIGHFISYDRARVSDEYLPETTGLRFLDTMSMHISISGLTTTQRHLKLASDKHLYNNKLWRSFFPGSSSRDQYSPTDGNAMSNELKWITEASLNGLVDVFRFYCKKDPPQNKDKRAVFEKGAMDDVVNNFQELATYCATDVLMTFEVFRELWPQFKERFPHPVTLGGLLEMGSMYLPTNQSWIRFQQQGEKAYTSLQEKQREMLKCLAEDALRRHSGPSKTYEGDPWLWDLDWSKPTRPANKTEAAKEIANLPKWYRDLIPKPIKENYKSGPSLITAQMKIAPKLLRLCWQGLPLHFDQELMWGTLIPGRIPKPIGDPRFYEQQTPRGRKGSQAASRCLPMLLPSIPATKRTAAGAQELCFPYKVYLNFWEKELDRRILGVTTPDGSEDSARSAYHQRVDPDPRDELLLEEFRRSIEVMPLDTDVVARLRSELRSLQGTDPTPTNQRDYPIYNYLWDLQVKGASFWQDKDRYETKSTKRHIPKTRRRLRKGPIETINPYISTCWFNPLPHEAGEGLPVGSPLSRPFQVHIAAGRLHSVPLEADQSLTFSTPQTVGLANEILRDRIRASFWQSYSKRIASQICVFLPRNLLPERLQTLTSTSRDILEQFRFGVILPQVIAAGTISRRAVEPLWLTASNAETERLGSEIKAMVQSPPGYSIVGADVDSQEMWIASLIGDSTVGFQGGTPYGWMTLEGSKAKGTDLHTKTAQLIGISRTEAKILNYARLYGSGMEFTKHLLSKFQTNLRPEEADTKAEKLMKATKGQRVTLPMDDQLASESSLRYVWKGGTESAVFNALEAIARSPQPRTPVLGAQITRALVPAVVKNDFLPSRINWVVQSSAVDYLHCLLVCMAWLIKLYRLPARLCISIHDEVRYLCDSRCSDQMALALQISNLLTRSFFAYQLGMRDLPESVAYFSSVDIDTCLRKDPTDDCKTPSNPEGLQVAYGIPRGQCLSIADVIRRTGGKMRPFAIEDEPGDEISEVQSTEKVLSSRLHS